MEFKNKYTQYTLSRWLQQCKVKQFDDDRQEWFPVSLCGAAWMDQSVTEPAPVAYQQIVEQM